ncbi:hypothetical protein BFJ63_vAg16903 [Fusarium oxysporum f. sp. narcissi]|uniref:MARVEL domain-containing protein n=1 Tax=Fusarium oxysporum f. sp. narcissi TaxID=451672 RepID=A0A4Q2V013_FUSOX|nr:hypothetical protein BFJ63_vAg16903 [Fusarium oxysporum f. sp. narcissi]
MAESGVAHKVISVILRLSELASAIIVLGILSRITYLVGLAEASVDGRIIYTIVVACLGIMYSIFFCPPFRSMFLGFPFDFLLFVMWLVAYCLLQTGVYVFRTYVKLDETKRDIKNHAEKLTKPDPRANGYNRNIQQQNSETTSV